MLCVYIEKHLEDRGVILNNSKYPMSIDKENNLAFFHFFNLSGQFLGYQRYNPYGIKTGVCNKDRNNETNKNLRYFTYITKENTDKNITSIAVYGLHTLDKRPYVFVVEGIFDAIKLIRLNQPVVAVITNDPKRLKNFFFILQKKVIVIADNDNAGKELNKIGDYVFNPPNEYNDLGDMSLDEVKKFVDLIFNDIKMGDV